MTETSVPKLVREAIRGVLMNRTVAGASVFKTRMTAIRPKEYPVIGIYTPLELIDQDSIETAPRVYMCFLTVMIETALDGPTPTATTPIPANPIDDLVDDLAQQIKELLFADRTLGGLVYDLWLVQTENAVNVDGDVPLGGFRMTLTARYEVPEFDHDPELGVFARFTSKQNLNASQQPADQAEDDVEMEQ